MHVGILGCGQLARLMALAGKKQGIEFSFIALDNESTRCVQNLGKVVHWNRCEDAAALLQALGDPDVITVEREDVDTRLMIELSMNVRVYPSPEAVATCQNRLKEKLALSKLNIPCTPWLSVSDHQSVHQAIKLFDYPVVIKALEQGYDGKNQWHIRDELALQSLLKKSVKIDWIIEPMIDFVKEASLIGVRSAKGEVKFYPLTENRHQDGILRTSIAPENSVSQKNLKTIQDNMKKLLEHWQYVGVIAMELFILEDGFLVNELAPRVHNSGHWTDNEQITSQFENHIRSVLGLPLGSTRLNGFAGMINILGTEQNRKLTQPVEGVMHLYNKTYKQNRKLGHINLTDKSRSQLLRKLNLTEKSIYDNGISPVEIHH